jgi:hypothetical protein
MRITLDGMAKPKKPADPTPDRHKKKPFQLRLHRLLRQQLELLAERNVSDLTSEISIAVRERLERNGLWPPQPD